MKGIWDLEWTLCEWYRLNGDTKEPICQLSPKATPDDQELQCKQNSSLSGGLYSAYRCNLKVTPELVTADISGSYLLIMTVIKKPF